jgi:hypothetical protein
VISSPKARREKLIRIPGSIGENGWVTSSQQSQHLLSKQADIDIEQPARSPQRENPRSQMQHPARPFTGLKRVDKTARDCKTVLITEEWGKQ